MTVIIDDIAIPLNLDTFVAPDLKQALDYYGSYKRHGGTLPFGGYVCAILKEIDKANPNEYDGNKAIQAFILHVGGTRAFIQMYYPYMQDGEDSKWNEGWRT